MAGARLKIMLAYLDDPARKQLYLNRVRRHREADEITQKLSWLPDEPGGGEYTKGRGCSVGCTLETYEHNLYPKLLGVPAEIAYLHEAVFEGLPKAEAVRFPEQFLEAIPVGADLSLVWPRFALTLLTDERYEVLRHVSKPRFAEQGAAVKRVAELFQEWLTSGVKPAEGRWKTATGATWVAADRAQDWTCRKAVLTAARAAEVVVRAAEEALGAMYAAEQTLPVEQRPEFWVSTRDLLLRILAEVPVGS